MQYFSPVKKFRFAHYALCSVFVYPEEDYTAIKKKLIELFPFDLQKENIAVCEEKSTGTDNRTIIILKIRIIKIKHILDFMKNLLSGLNEQQRLLLLTKIDKMIDERCFCVMKLEKNKFLQNTYWLVEKGDCFHIKIKIASYPRNKENAVKLLKETIKTLI